MIEFFMPMIPPTVTAQEKKVHVINGKPIIYDTPEINKAKTKLIGHLENHKPPQPITAACRLIVNWCFQVTGKHYDGEYKYKAGY